VRESRSKQKRKQIGDQVIYESYGLLRSTDSGETWQVLKNGLPRHFSIEFELAINSKGHIFAGGWGSVYRSTDNGQNWMKIDLKNEHGNALIVDAHNTLSAGTGHGIFRSTDEGKTWESANSPIWDVYVLAVGGQDQIFIGGLAGQVYFSAHGDSPWIKSFESIVPILTLAGRQICADPKTRFGAIG
jgi:photosystem II stability/assembly factor-like uncharacterized protein